MKNRETPRDIPSEPPSADGNSFAARLGLDLSGAVVLCLALLGPFAWLLRDGLGPDATTSAGWSAATRTFWCFYWGPAILLAALVFISLQYFTRRPVRLESDDR